LTLHEEDEMTDQECHLVLQKLLLIKKEIEEIRNINDIPAIDQALRIADLYCFVSTQHLGYTEAVFPAQEWG
jgi:hypothetical protein